MRLLLTAYHLAAMLGLLAITFFPMAILQFLGFSTVLLRLNHPWDWAVHAGLFCLLAYYSYQLYIDFHPKRAGLRIIIYLVCAIVLAAAMDEFFQSSRMQHSFRWLIRLRGHRVASFADWLADVTGLSLGLYTSVLVGRRRSKMPTAATASPADTPADAPAGASAASGDEAEEGGGDE